VRGWDAFGRRVAPGLRRPGREGFDLLVLATLACASTWVLGLDLWQVAAHGRIWTGADGVWPADQMQSLAWIQGILHHGASPDLFVLTPTAADFFQPLVAISAGLTGLGLAPWLALLVWKPVAVAAIFLATRAYVRRALAGKWPRRAALALALFFCWGSVIGDGWIPFWSWGYPFALLALASALGALLAYERDRAAGRVGWLAPALGALASWLHPWQGETLILVLLASEFGMCIRGARPALAPLALTAVATALPLSYFAVLVLADTVWRLEREGAISTYPSAHVASAFAPLLAPALLAYRRRPEGFIPLTARAWPLATIAVFAFSEWKGSGPTHALLGVTIPLGVLAVEGLRSIRWRPLARPVAVVSTCALAGLTIQGTAEIFGYAYANVVPPQGNANFITSDENAALAYLARDRSPGGVLTRFYLGMVVPARTARNTYVGDCYWSEPHCPCNSSAPGCHYRSVVTDRLFAGDLSPPAARRFVESTGARFVIADCHAHNLTGVLAPLTTAIHRFGCASVYTIR
jgi:hypothetical protein